MKQILACGLKSPIVCSLPRSEVSFESTVSTRPTETAGGTHVSNMCRARHSFSREPSIMYSSPFQALHGSSVSTSMEQGAGGLSAQAWRKAQVEGALECINLNFRFCVLCRILLEQFLSDWKKGPGGKHAYYCVILTTGVCPASRDQD